MEIVKINLENEMDLMLAYKKSMKLAELCGMSVLIQTSFATAVSEIARCVIKNRKDNPVLSLEINELDNKQKELTATVISNTDFIKTHADALKYARRLSDHVTLSKDGTSVKFVQPVIYSRLITNEKLQSFIKHFKTEPPLSPYDEIRKKNILLLEVTEKLRVSENRYRELTRTLPLMIFTTNSLGNLTYANKHLLDYFRLGELPEKLSWTHFMHTSETKRVRDDWEQTLQTPAIYKTQAKIRGRTNNDFLWHMVSISPAKNDDNLIAGWVGFFADIHAQKLIEETLKDNKELKEAQKQLVLYQKNLEEKVFELNRSNHDLEQFAYIASHDLQEPLRKIRNFANLAKKDLTDKETLNKYIVRIESSSERMTRLIKDVLDYSRLMNDESVFTATDLNETFQNIRLDMELLLTEKAAVLEIGELPVLKAIPQQMYQLFYNLLGNAIKFCNSQPVIKVYCRPAAGIERFPDLSSKKKYTEIIFEDNGIGINEKYSEQIFIIFKRLHSKASFPGTGIGLAVCKKIVDNHHGAIYVESEENKGARFHIILPVSG